MRYSRKTGIKRLDNPEVLESSPYASRESTTESGMVEIKVSAVLDGIGSLAISSSCGLV